LRGERLSEMVSFIERKGIVSMEDLCSVFDIALSTARKDISYLAAKGAVQKVYGGAKAINKSSFNDFLTYERRSVIDKEEKLMVARKAASFVEEGDIIFLDSGTTTARIIDFLQDKQVAIFTANVEVLIKAMKYDNLEVYFIGGKLNRKSCSTEKFWAMDHLKNFNIGKAFMAASGYSIKGGATHGSPWEYETKRYAVERAMETYLVITNMKIDKKTLVKYADANEIKNVITDKEVKKNYREYFEKNGITLYVAER